MNGARGWLAGACVALLGSACAATIGGECPDAPCDGAEGHHVLAVTVSSGEVPVAGALVSGGERSSVTDDGGRASLGALPEGEVRVRVSADGFVTRELRVLLEADLTLSVVLRPVDDLEPVPEPVPGADDAEIEAAEFPPALACGAPGEASVQVRNTGSTTWRAEDGYALGAVGDTDPLSRAVRIPPGAPVGPGETWRFPIPLLAPAAAGVQVSAWQMVREHVAWFGTVASGSVDISCGEPLPEVPDVRDTVRAVAAAHAHLLEINTYESCGELVQRVLAALSHDPEWGHVGKTSGESQHTPAGFEPRWVDGHLVTGFSHDVIYHRASHRQVDIIVNAAANSDHRPEIWGPASIGWDVIPPEHYRENNPWLPPVPVP